MIEDILEVLFSPLGLIYLSLFPAGRRLVRRTAKALMHTVYDISDEIKAGRAERSMPEDECEVEPSGQQETKAATQAANESFEPFEEGFIPEMLPEASVKPA